MRTINRMLRRPLLALSLSLMLGGCMATRLVSEAIDAPVEVHRTLPSGERETRVEPGRNYWLAVGYLFAVPFDIVTLPFQAVFAPLILHPRPGRR